MYMCTYMGREGGVNFKKETSSLLQFIELGKKMIIFVLISDPCNRQGEEGVCGP